MTGPFRRPGRRPNAEDDERFGELYEDTSRALLAFLLRRCQTAEDAADCLAETYRIAWEKRARLPAGGDGRAWVFGVARNVAREESRRTERRAATSVALAAVAESSYTDPTPEDGEFAAALAQLSPVDREIITMLGADGLAPREVAAVLGLSPNVVRVRAHRARERLRALMSGEDALPSVAALAAVPPLASTSQAAG